MKKIIISLILLFSIVNVNSVQGVNASYTLNPYSGAGSVRTGSVLKTDWDSAVVNNQSGLGWFKSVAFRVRDKNHDYATEYIDANSNGRYYLPYRAGKAQIEAYYYLYASRNSGSGAVSGVWAP